ncbi:MAG: hypothetical protein IJZ82_03650 [Lachnospiraceae bacterium]|nr:hypothetical protein [Lachnospiraceae bacterium]
MTEQKWNYLTDEELEKLIQDVENRGMLSCPSYVRGEILQKTGVSLEKRKMQFYLYSAKVCAAAAAAIFLLFTIPAGPMVVSGEDMVAKDRFSFTDKLNKQTTAMCESLNDFSDMLILREKQED